MTDSRDDMGRAGAVLGGRYELLEQIGSGASAITWKARDPRLGRTVAIKVLRRSYASDPTFAQRFEREAQAAASLSHGNVVDVYDVGQDGDSLYLVMQFIDGEDLKHLIQRRGHLTMDQARAITTQVLAGLDAIHKAGIIHRDVKPQNVLMGRDGVARLTDFGVAQVAVDVGLTTQGTTVGTAAYMAPEQAKADTLSEATDVYAVGVMLYEMLTGKLPYTGATPMALMLAHIQQEPVPPSAVAPEFGIATAFDNIVMQAMAKVPSDRFRTAGAMARALANASMAQGATSAQTVATPAAMTGSRTRVAPAASAGAASSIPRPVAVTSTGGRPADLEWARQSTSGGDLSGGMRGVLWGFLFLIALALLAIGWYAWSEFGGNDDPTDSRGNGVPTRTVEPTEDDEDDGGLIVPPGDDEEGPPTDEPTEEPTDEPTDEVVEPTDEPTDEPTEQVIEPSDPTNPPGQDDAGGEDVGTGDEADAIDPGTDGGQDIIVPNTTQSPDG